MVLNPRINANIGRTVNGQCVSALTRQPSALLNHHSYPSSPLDVRILQNVIYPRSRRQPLFPEKHPLWYFFVKGWRKTSSGDCYWWICPWFERFGQFWCLRLHSTIWCVYSATSISSSHVTRLTYIVHFKFICCVWETECFSCPVHYNWFTLWKYCISGDIER